MQVKQISSNQLYMFFFGGIKLVPASKRFQGFLFDLDGTLLDTAPIFSAALNHLLGKPYKPELLKMISEVLSQMEAMAN